MRNSARSGARVATSEMQLCSPRQSDAWTCRSCTERKCSSARDRTAALRHFSRRRFSTEFWPDAYRNSNLRPTDQTRTSPKVRINAFRCLASCCARPISASRRAIGNGRASPSPVDWPPDASRWEASSRPPSPSSASPASGSCSEGSPAIVIPHKFPGRTLRRPIGILYWRLYTRDRTHEMRLSYRAERPVRRKIGQQTEEIAMQRANLELCPVGQPNVLPFSASWRCYPGNLARTTTWSTALSSSPCWAVRKTTRPNPFWKAYTRTGRWCRSKALRSPGTAAAWAASRSSSRPGASRGDARA